MNEREKQLAFNFFYLSIKMAFIKSPHNHTSADVNGNWIEFPTETAEEEEENSTKNYIEADQITKAETEE